MRRWQEPEEEEDERYFGLTPMQFNLAVFLVLGLVGLAAFLYFGGVGIVDDYLSDGEKSSASRAEEPGDEAADDAVTPTPTVAPATPEEAAEAALLTIYDLPLGWRRATEEEEEDDIDLNDEDFSEECRSSWGQSEADELASADSPTFEGPADEEIEHSVSVFASPEAAGKAFDATVAAFDACGPDFVNAFELGVQLAAQEEGELFSDYGIETSFDRVSPGESVGGDNAAVFRLSALLTVQDVIAPFMLDFVLSSEGKMASYVSFFSTPDSEAEEVALLKKASEKVANANASLGE